MQCLVWLACAAAVAVDVSGTEQVATSALSARVYSANGLRLAGDDGPKTEDERQAQNYVGFVASTIVGPEASAYDIPGNECATKCDEMMDGCEGYIRSVVDMDKGAVCQLMQSRDVVKQKRSQFAAKHHSAEFAYVKKRSMPMPHAKAASFTKGWHNIKDRAKMQQKASVAHPWWTTHVPSSLELDLGYHAMVTSVTMANPKDSDTGADQVKIFAKTEMDAKHPDGWVRVGQARLFTHEQLDIPVEPCHTRYVKIEFDTFHGLEGAVNLTKLVVNGGIAISLENMKHHHEELAKRRELEAEMKKSAGMLQCPLVSTYGSNPSIRQLATWGVKRGDCRCAHVYNEQTTGRTDELIARQINRWAQTVKSGPEFASEMFTPLYQAGDLVHHATIHYTNNSGKWVDKVSAKDFEEFKQAESTGMPPPLRYYLFMPLGVRGKSRGVQFAGLKFQFHDKDVDTTGAVARAISGSVAEGQEPQNLLDDDANTVYFNTQKDAGIVIDFGKQVQIDSFVIQTADNKPQSDPVMWVLQGGYDGESWPLVLSKQEVTGKVPQARSTRSAPIFCKAQLLSPEEEKSEEDLLGEKNELVTSETAIKGLNDWNSIKYELKEGENVLHEKEVPAQCLAMSCLNYAITHSPSGCQVYLKRICKRFAKKITGCPNEWSCEEEKADSCVVFRVQSDELTDHYLSGAVQEAHDLHKQHQETTYAHEKKDTLLDPHAMAAANETATQDDAASDEPAAGSLLDGIAARRLSQLRVEVGAKGQLAQ